MYTKEIFAHEYFTGKERNFRIDGNYLKYEVSVGDEFIGSKSKRRKKIYFSTDKQDCWFYSGKTIVWVIHHDCMGVEEYNFLRKEE